MKDVKHLNILIIDDDEDMCKELRDILSVNKYNVDIASNGGQGLDLLNRKKYNLMLLDLKMVGINGYDVLENVKTQFPDLKVIVVTGCVLNGDKVTEEIKPMVYNPQKTEILKMADFVIHKPYDVEFLLAKIKEILAR